MQALLPAHAAATWFMTGLIWFVHIVHYPLMAAVGEENFAAYETSHARRTGWIVGPVMLVEAATAVALVAGVNPEIRSGQAWLGLGLVIFIWLSTALLQAPAHRKLHHGFDAGVHARLVSTNRLRVGAWTARAFLVGGWLG